jgi:sensor histidine kinase regulating citrate/malate metabolism
MTIHSRLVDGVKQLVISDNGLGFDMDNVKDKIFGRNQKFHHHDDSKGIGLYLVHNHITSIGGRIHVESELNEGATFIISF